MQAGDGGRLYKGIFGTRCEATICVKVQLSDTQISIGKRQGFYKESSLREKEQIKSRGTECIDGGKEERTKKDCGARGKGGRMALIKEKRKPKNEQISQRKCK